MGSERIGTYVVIAGGRVIGLFGIVLGFAIVAFAVFSFSSNLIFLTNAISTDGMITGFVRDIAKRTATPDDYLKVRFITQEGQTIEFQSDLINTDGQYTVGQTVTIIYDPQHPANARVADAWQLWFQFACLGAGGLGFVAFGLIGIIGIGKMAFPRRQRLAVS